MHENMIRGLKDAGLTQKEIADLTRHEKDPSGAARIKKRCRARLMEDLRLSQKKVDLFDDVMRVFGAPKEEKP